MIQLENDEVCWETQPDFALLLPGLLQSAGQRIKDSPVKEVTRHEFAGRVFYIKRYRHEAVPLRGLKYWFMPSQAREEWQLARELEDRGIPVVRHLALGERRIWRGVRESVLITEGFPGVPLEQAPGTDPVAVLKFVERLHAAGVLQEDLHPGNLLVRAEPFELRLVDLHGTRLLRALTPEQRRRNLARLRVAFPIPVDRETAELSASIRRQLLRDRSRRCLRHNREFAPMRLGALRWWIRQPDFSDVTRAIAEDPDRFLESRARLLKQGRSSTVGCADHLVLKRYNLRKWENLAKDLFRASKGRRAYRQAYHLELAGVPTARIVGTADRRRLGVLVRSYVLMEEIPGALDLGTWLERLGGNRPDGVVVRRVAQLLARLHNEGFMHRDLKETNIVLDRERQPHLIDLDGLVYLGCVPETRAAADLERFARGVARSQSVVRGDRVRFLLAYCRARRLRRVPRTAGLASLTPALSPGERE